MRVEVRAESWPIAGGFRIARGARANAEVLVVELQEGDLIGRGECVPYARYGETTASVEEQIRSAFHNVDDEPTLASLADRLPAGAARNAVDCALWDLEARRAGRPVSTMLGSVSAVDEVVTMRTISIGTPQAMADAAKAFPEGSVLKVKVDGDDSLGRLSAVHEAVPSARLVVDANESWSSTQLERWLPRLPELGVVVLEQPLPAQQDESLASFRGGLPFCADESFHDRASFDAIADRYDMVNLKLDKAGGLTEAWAALEEARRRGLKTMVGCMVSTSLAIAPALVLAPRVDFVDLDGPLLLERDRRGTRHDASRSLLRASSEVWGG
ncbi:MAG: N-acetyl-D-Glu racemase DgcA [Myxococcota bacterium]